MMTISKHIWEMGKRTLESGFFERVRARVSGICGLLYNLKGDDFS